MPPRYHGEHGREWRRVAPLRRGREFTSRRDAHRAARRTHGGISQWTRQALELLLHLLAVKISRDEIRHVALLARLALDPAEEEAMTTTLNAILTYMEKLEELDTSAVEPTAHILDLPTPWREDVVTNAPKADALLANAPARDGDFFRVPKIIE